MNLVIIFFVQQAMTVSELTDMSAMLNKGLDSEMFVTKCRVDPVKKGNCEQSICRKNNTSSLGQGWLKLSGTEGRTKLHHKDL